MDEVKITSYSLIALLVLAILALAYTCKIVNFSSDFSGADSKVVAGFKA